MEKLTDSINKISVDAQTGFTAFWVSIGAIITFKASKWFGDTMFQGLKNGIVSKIEDTVKVLFKQHEEKTDTKLAEIKNDVHNIKNSSAMKGKDAALNVMLDRVQEVSDQLKILNEKNNDHK